MSKVISITHTKYKDLVVVVKIVTRRGRCAGMSSVSLESQAEVRESVCP